MEISMTDREQLEQAIMALENQRAVLGDSVVDAALVSMHEKLSALIEAQNATQQRKLATVLFMDIVGSTSITRDLDPEDTMTIMDTALQRLANPVYAHGGRVTRFMGDGFLALFGAPVARENEPEIGIRAGLQILAEAHVYAREVKAQWHIPDFNVRVGISTGMVIIGGDSEAENTIMGTTVNLAARLEKAARPGTLLISHQTYQHIRGLFDLKLLEPMTVKGFAAPIQVYQVLRAKPPTFRMSTRSVAGIETRMVGRDPELLMLQNMFRDTTEDADVHIVTVVGDAGVGKSRLLYEFENWIELLPEGIRNFKGRATPETEAMPYGLFRRTFALHFEIMESDSAAEVREKFRSGMSAALDSDQADLVGQLLGLDFSASQAVQAQLGSESFGELATAHLAKYLRTIASEPTVFYLEDIHWADDSSLDLLDHLMAAVPDTRLLVVCLTRPLLFERRPNWGEGQEFHTQINLKPLSRRASRALVGEILRKAGDVPTDLRDLIVEGAEGNPFYVEELIKMLIEDGVIIHGKDNWRVEPERLAGVHVPPTLTGVLQARLDSLPPDEKMLLQRAAVVGRLFWDAAVVELKAKVEGGLDREKISSLLEVVRDRELIFRRERSAFVGAEEYIFKHALLRDVTYETVLLKLRRVYHKQVARWLEVAAGKRIGEYLGLIAGHFELAGEVEKAVEYLLHAGDQARLTYACQEASGYYQRALPLLDKQGKQDQAARTLMKLGLTYDLAFDFQRARQAYEQGFTLWQRTDETQVEDLPPAPHPLRLPASDPPTLDPTIADNVVSSAKIIQLFSGLVELRPDAGVVPDVAQSWEVLEGGKKYIFHLRDDVLWSDGMPVTAGDFEFGWKRVLGAHNTFSIPRLLYDVRGAKSFHQGDVSDPGSVGVKALDEVTLTVELEGPTGYFLHLLANAVTFPVPKHVVELHGESWAEPENIVTCGSFRLESWQPGERMTLVRNPDYHGRFTGNLERVELLLRDIGPATGFEMLEMYEEDQLDVVNIASSDMKRVRHQYAGEYRKVPRLITMYTQFDVDRPPFDDVRVRRAFVLATDREALVKATRPDCFPATGGFVPPGMPGHSPGIGLSYDPAQARQLLAEAGYPDGRGFPVVECLTMPDRVDIGEHLQAQWRENLGVKIGWEMIEGHAFLARLGEHMPHLFILGWRADYPDPDNFLRARIGDLERQRWQNKGYDSLVKGAQRSLDQMERMKLYEEAERILAEEAPIMPIFHWSTRLLVKPWVTRFPTTGLREWFFKDVIIQPHQ
jgi:ABC-type oligopeptide transport system substrate-binding subunit/class 3 adenylate cyclase